VKLTTGFYPCPIVDTTASPAAGQAGGVLRAEPGLFGPVASDATVSRTIDVLAKHAPAPLKAVAKPEWPPSGCLDHLPNPDDGLGSP
jgi:hypothetical protein